MGALWDAIRIVMLEMKMATVNKSDRKKLVGTQILGSVIVFQRMDTGEEFARLDTAELAEDVTSATLIYGAKQIVADIVASADGAEAKVAGMIAAIDSLKAGVWPRRQGAPVSMDKAIETMMKALGETEAQVRARLGMTS